MATVILLASLQNDWSRMWRHEEQQPVQRVAGKYGERKTVLTRDRWEEVRRQG